MPSPKVGEDGEAARSALLAYLSYGFSVLPILPGTKQPLAALLPSRHWSPYQKQPPSQADVNRWVDQRPDTGVGIICGQVSGGLYCMDVDNIPFSLWLEQRASVLETLGAWIVKTGSGKLHVYLRATEKTYTTVMIGSGGKLADIRGDGAGNAGPSYVVAPPSIHPLTNKPYATLSGSPEYCRSVHDARAVFDQIRDKYLAQSHTVETVEDDDEPVDYKVARETPAPADDVAIARSKERIQASARLSRRTKHALFKGAQAGDPGWTAAPSNSEIDYQIVKELLRAGWEQADIYEIYTWSPLADNRYNRKKGSFGREYIRLAIEKALKAEAEAAEAASKAEGTNFKVTQVVRIGTENPVYEVTVLQTQPVENTGTIQLTVDDLMDEHRFKRAVMAGVNFLPNIHDALIGRKFEKFGALMLSMATDEVVPERATAGGHLRATIRAFIEDEARIEEPTDYRMVTLGWRRNGAVLVRPGALLQRLQAVIYPRPKPEEAWTVLRALGGQEVGHSWPDGKRESVWLIPLGKQPGLQS